MNKLIPIIIFCALLFIACSDDDTDRTALRYLESESALVELRMFTGSASGGEENLRPDTLRRNIAHYFPASNFESFTSTTISFVNEKIIVQQSGINEIFSFRFEDGSLYVDKNGDEKYYGDGDQSALDIRQHYIGYKTGDVNFEIIQALPAKNLDVESAASQSAFGSIAAMVNIEDTLIWVTRRSAFR